MKHYEGEKVLITKDTTKFKNDFQKEWAGKDMIIDKIYTDEHVCNLLNVSEYYHMKEDKTSDYAGSLWTENQIEIQTNIPKIKINEESVRQITEDIKNSEEYKKFTKELEGGG